MALEGIQGLIQGLENQESWQSQKQFRLVVQHWPKTVGFAVARQTRPLSIQRDTLYVATATAAWAQTLAYERINILRKLNRYQRRFIKNIRFSSAQWSQPSQPPAQPLSQQHPSYVGQRQSDGAAGFSERVPQTSAEAFKRWAATIQHQQSTQALCSQCRCHCPTGELERWGICALCAAKQWQ